MAKILVLGGTGYVGSNVVANATARGHEVISVSRNLNGSQIDGVQYVQASVTDLELVRNLIKGADVVFASVQPRGELENTFHSLMIQIAEICRTQGVRFGMAGGAGSLQVNEHGQLLMDTDGFPPVVRTGSVILCNLLSAMRELPNELDWFVITPPAGFRSGEPGEAIGRYRVGADVLLKDSDGNSFISGIDFGLAVVDELETPTHHRSRFTVAY
jgi:putative NADH-flavin reductase